MTASCRRSLTRHGSPVTTVLLLTIWLAIVPGAQASEDDSWEGFNRRVFAFNEFVDRWLLKPVARGYVWITPRFVDDAVSNVFSNLGEVGNFTNNLLQGKVDAAATDVSRLLLNSTFGLAGLIDLATRAGVERSEEDFGQTLGTWKVASGPYLVLPFLGPSTVRDAFGRIPDHFLEPQTYIDHDRTRWSVSVTDLVDTRADLLDTERLIQGDRYTFIRDAYLQRRAYLLADGEVEDDFTSDDFEDEEYEDEYYEDEY